jgi:hypothetical protein
MRETGSDSRVQLTERIFKALTDVADRAASGVTSVATSPRLQL